VDVRPRVGPLRLRVVGQVKDFNLDAVLNQEFQTSEMQPVLYAVESFDQIYEATKQAEGRLA